MPKAQPTHNSSIDELEAWINNSSKCSNKKKLKKIDQEVKSNKELQIKTKEDDKLNKKILLKDKYSRESDPLYGKKGAERKHVIEEYRKQHKQQQMLKNSNNSNEVSPEMINNFMNKIKNNGHNPEEIMKKLESDQYSSEYKNQLMEDILK